MMFIQRTVARIPNSIYHRIYLSGYRGWKMPHIIRKLITGSELYNAWNLGYNDWVLERIGTPMTGKDAECEYFCPHCDDHSLTSEEIKASDELLAKFEREYADYKANEPSEYELWADQWNDYYEYTGMADLVRESLAKEESKMQGQNCEVDAADEFSEKSGNPMLTDEQTAKK